MIERNVERIQSAVLEEQGNTTNVRIWRCLPMNVTNLLLGKLLHRRKFPQNKRVQCSKALKLRLISALMPPVS